MGARSFNLTTDYPIEKVVFNVTGSQTVPANTDDNLIPGISIPHNLPFTPLPVLVWSNTPDFAISYTSMDGDYAKGGMPATGQFYQATTDSNNLYITRYSMFVGVKQLYYRVYCLEPSTLQNNSIKHTDSVGSSFTLNTDNNYMKVFKRGVLTHYDRTFAHNLGYKPRIDFWAEVGGLVGYNPIAQYIGNDPTGSGGGTSGVYADDKNITWLNPNAFDRVHYRIYADE